MGLYCKKRAALLLILCLTFTGSLQPALAVYASENSIAAGQGFSQKNEISENVSASENTEVPGYTDISAEGAVSSEYAVSEDYLPASGETVSEEDICDDSEAVLAKKAFEAIIEKKAVMALVYDCSSYDLKSKPEVSSDTVISVPRGTTVYLKDVGISAGNVWFEAVVYADSAEYTGYIEKSSLAYADEDLTAWENEYLSFIIAPMGISSVDNGISQFPSSFQAALTSVAASHPNWIFVPYDVGVSFEEAVAGELSDKNKNLIYYTADDSYKNGVTGQSKWYYASEACVRHYMDPRNFLSEKYLFQFEQLTYNSSYHTESGIQSFLSDTFMSGTIPGDSQTYAHAFYSIGAYLGVSPFHLASRVYQEQGKYGKSSLISGTYSGYENLYNYFNIGASGTTDTDVVVSGLKYARNAGWTTRYKSLYGGAGYILDGYILKGQDEIYLQKYNVGSSYYARYTHQYMQNAQAPSTESASAYNLYKNAGAINSPYVFKIPVYTDMKNDKSLKLSSSSLTWKDVMNDASPKQLTAAVVAPDTFDRTVTWSSSNENAALVSSSGLVTPVSIGTATITASAVGLTAKCQVRAMGLTVSAGGKTISEDSDYGLTVNGIDSERTLSVNAVCSSDPSFTSSDTGIIKVTVDSAKRNAVLTAVGIGYATVTVAGDGFTRKLNILAGYDDPLNGAALNKDSETLKENDSFDLYLHAVPLDRENTSVQTVSWNVGYADKSDTATVSELSLSDTSSLPGEAITVTAVSGCKAVSAEVTGTLHALDKEGNPVTFMRSCLVTTEPVWSDTDKNAVSAAVSASDLWVLTNRSDKSKVRLGCVSLSSLNLPAGVSAAWESPDTVLAANASVPVQYFNAIMSKEGCCSYNIRIPVNVSRITGVRLQDVTGVTLLHPSVTGTANTIHPGTSRTYQAVINVTGRLPSKASLIALSLNTASLLDITSSPSYDQAKGCFEFTVSCSDNAAAGTSRISAELVAGEAGEAVKGQTLFSSSQIIKTDISDCADAVSITGPDGIPQTVSPVKYTVSQGAFKTIRVAAEDIAAVSCCVIISADAYRNGIIKTNTKISWKSSDPAVASVKPGRNGTVLKIRKAGAAVITATANDRAGACCSILIEVEENRPELENTSAELNVWKKTGIMLGAVSRNGYGLSSAEIFDTALKVSPVFKTAVSGENVEISFVNDDVRKQYQQIGKKQKIKCILSLTALNGTTGDTVARTFAVTVSIVCSKPAVTFSQMQKANMFYVSGDQSEAVYRISSEEVVTAVTDKNREKDISSGIPRFVLDAYSQSDRTVTLLPSKLSNENRSAFGKTLQLYLSFEGYDDIPYTVKVGTVYSVPAIVTDTAAVFNTLTDSGNIIFKDKKTGAKIILPDDAELKFLDDSGKITAGGINSDHGSFSYTADGFTSGKTIKYLISSAMWIKPVSISTKFTAASSMTAVLGTSRIVLNSNLNAQKNGSSAVSISVKGSDIGIESVVIGAAGTNVPLLTSGYLHYAYDSASGTVYFGLNEGCRSYTAGSSQQTMKAGSYRLTVTGITRRTASNASTRLKAVAITIVIQDTAVEKLVALSGKGTINLVDRADSCVLYTPRLSYTGTDALASVEFPDQGGLNTSDFKVSLLSYGDTAPDGTVITSAAGVICLQAVSGSALYKGTRYTLMLRCTLKNNAAVTKTITVVPGQKAAKTYAAASKLVSATNGQARLFSILSEGQGSEDSLIGAVCLAEDGRSKYFTYIPETASGTSVYSGKLIIKNGSYPPVGNYNLKFKVKYCGQAVNASDRTVSMTVNVR